MVSSKRTEKANTANTSGISLLSILLTRRYMCMDKSPWYIYIYNVLMSIGQTVMGQVRKQNRRFWCHFFLLLITKTEELNNLLSKELKLKRVDSANNLSAILCWVAFYLHKDLLINSDSFGAECGLNKVVKPLDKPMNF